MKAIPVFFGRHTRSFHNSRWYIVVRQVVKKLFSSTSLRNCCEVLTVVPTVNMVQEQQLHFANVSNPNGLSVGQLCWSGQKEARGAGEVAVCDCITS